MDLLSFGLVAVASKERVVEVLASSAHAAYIERNHGPGELTEGADLGLWANGQHSSGDHVHLTKGWVSLRSANRKVLAPDRSSALRVKQDWQPTIGQLGSELHILRTKRSNVNGDIRPSWVRNDLERLA